MCSEGEQYDNVKRGSTRDVSVGEERKKSRGWGVMKVAPERIESFVESSRSAESSGEEDAAGGCHGGKGWGDSEAACLQESATPE